MSPSLRQWLAKLGGSPGDTTWTARPSDEGSTINPIGSVADRQQVVLDGTLEGLALRSRPGTNWLEATLTDGTGSVLLVWMGRESIPGIEAGRHMRAQGRVGIVDGQRRIYNPQYTLL